MTEVEAPTIKVAIKKVILDALAKGYTSLSNKDGIATGNRYQSVTLGDEHTTGFRSQREGFLDQINFRDKRVLDLGANLGEISRAARARGAAIVDGFEYDGYFLEIANAINVYNDVTHVSFFRRDITDPTIYGEHYDIVVAFSVFIYLRDLVDKLRDITDGVLLLETHRLDGNLERTYLEPIGRFFPCHAILGRSDWGKGSADSDGERAIIAFAKSPDALRSYLPAVGGGGRSFSAARRRDTKADIHAIDVTRTAWYDRFFDTFAFNSAEELLSAVDLMDFNVDALARNRDLVKDLGGWVYWLAYLKGALQNAAGGAPESGNYYYDLLARHWRNDPGRAKDLDDPSRLSVLVRRRFDDFELFRRDREAPLKVAPAHIVITNGPPTPSATRGLKRVYEVGSEVPVETTTIDGYHRIFLARLFGHKQIPGDFVAEPDALPDPNA
jgi:SAM-dependent methyltransferase